MSHYRETDVVMSTFACEPFEKITSFYIAHYFFAYTVSIGLTYKRTAAGLNIEPARGLLTRPTLLACSTSQLSQRLRIRDWHSEYIEITPSKLSFNISINGLMFYRVMCAKREGHIFAVVSFLVTSLYAEIDLWLTRLYIWHSTDIERRLTSHHGWKQPTSEN